MKKRVLAIILLVALLLSAFAPAATATAPPNRLEQAMQAIAQATQGVMQAQGLSGIDPLNDEQFFIWSSPTEIVVPVGAEDVEIRFSFAGSHRKQYTSFLVDTTAPSGGSLLLTWPALLNNPPWGAPIEVLQGAPHRTLMAWSHPAQGPLGPQNGHITVEVTIDPAAGPGVLGTVGIVVPPSGFENNLAIGTIGVPVDVQTSTTTIRMAHFRTITLNPGEGGTFTGVDTEGWTPGAGGIITMSVPEGTPWDDIEFPEPVRTNPGDGFDFDDWNPEKPDGYVGEENFSTTAEWQRQGPARTITLDAGTGGTWPAPAPEGWTRSADGTRLTREVPNGTQWASVAAFPTPDRLVVDNFDFDGWNPLRPTTGRIEANYTFTAQWDRDGFHMIRLNAGLGGTYATAPTDWNRAENGSYIFRSVPTGTPWTDITTFPIPGRVTADGNTFNNWNPAQPASGNITEDFTSTAIWLGDDPSHEIVLHAGTGGTWPASVPGWNRTENGMTISRRVADETPWASISFPTPVRLAADGFTLVAAPLTWDPAQPTGLVDDDFESTAQWESAPGSHAITLRAGNGGIYAAAVPGWNLAVDGSYIFRAVPTGTAWDTIDFPEPVRVDPTDDYEFDGWAPEKPTGNITAHFISTAQWDDEIDPPDTRLVTLNAGIGGTWLTPAPEGWTRAENGMSISREVDLGSPWASITFPTPVRLNPADGFTLVAAPGTWIPAQLTGVVEDDFTSTAQWEREGFHTIVLNAGDGGTYATAPADWTRAADGSHIFRAVPTGTAWNTIDFTAPVRVDTTDGYVFESWDPAQPTGSITADFASTAQWDDDPEPGETRLITLNAGTGGTWPTPAPEGWTRSATGRELTREVDLGTPWASITFPTPVRLDPADGIVLVAAPDTWLPVQPTGNVTDDFTSTARWTPEDPNSHLIRLSAGLGGIFQVPAPTGWIRGEDGSYIYRVVTAGTPWDSILFTLPVRAVVDTFVFNVWDAARPDGNVNADFEATALWRDTRDDQTHEIILHAGTGGVFPTDVPGWERSADGTRVERTVDRGTEWNLVDFPLPVRPVPEGFVRAGWTLDRPTGTVLEDFESTALWNTTGNRVEIVLRAGDGGTFPATVPAVWTTRAADGSYITQIVDVGTAWSTIEFPEPDRIVPTDGYDFDGWLPEQPATGGITARFESTAQWDDGDGPDPTDHLITLNAGTGGTFAGVDLPTGWTRATDNLSIERRVDAGTPWANILFPLPVRAATDGIRFNVWSPAQLTGNVTADFTSTAQWMSGPDPQTRTITLNAGIGGTFQADAVSGEWNRAANGAQLTREVEVGTAWNLIGFPLPARAVPADGFTFDRWLPAHPGTGNVMDDFTSTAQWNPPANFQLIVLNAGDGGTYATAVTGWTRAVDNAYIWRTVATGTPWDTIEFPEPVRVDTTDDYVFDGWLPVRPTTGGITARFESTAQWDDDGEIDLNSRLITLNAGTGGTFAGVDLPTGWTRAANNLSIERRVPTGTAWASINFPLPVRAAEDGIQFNVWNLARPTGLVTEDFTSTAQWMSGPTAETRTITLLAGVGGTNLANAAPAEWTRAANGAQLTRVVEVGTPWNLIGFPLPVRAVPADGYSFNGWLPVQPTGDVLINFTSTAQWTDADGDPPRIVIDVNDDRSVNITNRPPGTDIVGDNSTDTGNITVTFPPGTDSDSIEIGDYPDNWTYVIGQPDADGYITVTFRPPGIQTYLTVRFHSGHAGVAPALQTVQATPTTTSTFGDVFRAGSTMVSPQLLGLGAHPDGYYFQGWFTQAGGQGTFMASATPFTTTTPYRDLQAHWASTPPQPPLPPDYPGIPGGGARVITFALNGGNIAGSAANVTRTIPVGGNMADADVPANPVQTGQIFMGWLETTPTGDTTRWVSNEMLLARINATTGNRTYTAQWATERTITFDLNQGNINGATANVVQTITAAQHATPTFGITNETIPANPTRAGHFFLGWLETTPAGNLVPWERTDAFVTHLRNSVGNRVYTAQWSTTRTITFDLAGGNINGNAANVVHSIGIAENLAPTFGIALGNIPANPVRPGFRFNGWRETTPAGNITDFQRNEAFVTHLRNSIGNRTYTAQWLTGPVPPSTEHRAFLIGFPDNTMRPQAALTRAEAATIFFRLIDDEFRAQPDVWSTSNNFADVLTNNWFNNAVSTMTRLDVIRGVSATTFAPSRSVTNGEFFAMLARFNRLVDTETITVNSPGGHWAEVYAVALEEANLITGFSGNAARLDATITRAAVAELINRGVTERVVENRDHLINTGPLRRSWTDLPATSPHYLNMVMAGHTVEYEIENLNTAGDWNGVRWTRIVRHIDWTVLEGPNARPQAILSAIQTQQVETAQIERNAAVEEALEAGPSI